MQSARKIPKLFLFVLALLIIATTCFGVRVNALEADEDAPTPTYIRIEERSPVWYGEVGYDYYGWGSDQVRFSFEGGDSWGVCVQPTIPGAGEYEIGDIYSTLNFPAIYGLCYFFTKNCHDKKVK